MYNQGDCIRFFKPKSDFEKSDAIVEGIFLESTGFFGNLGKQTHAWVEIPGEDELIKIDQSWIIDIVDAE